MSGLFVRSAAARPSRSPGSRGAGGLSWAGGLGGAGEDLGLDFVPCVPPSPEPERPHSCSAVQGVPVSFTMLRAARWRKLPVAGSVQAQARFGRICGATP